LQKPYAAQLSCTDIIFVYGVTGMQADDGEVCMKHLFGLENTLFRCINHKIIALGRIS